MQQQEMLPNAITCSALISASEKGKQPERALLWQWCSNSSCEKGNKLGRALKIFEAMVQQGVMPDAITYSALISACEKGMQSRRAMKAFATMVQQGLMPDGTT